MSSVAVTITIIVVVLVLSNIFNLLSISNCSSCCGSQQFHSDPYEETHHYFEMNLFIGDHIYFKNVVHMCFWL
jgi:hypothetical protein